MRPVHVRKQTAGARRDLRCRAERKYCLKNKVQGEGKIGGRRVSLNSENFLKEKKKKKKEFAMKWDILLTSKLCAMASNLLTYL